MADVTFKETQSFRQLQLWIPMIVLFAFVVSLQVYFIFRSKDAAPRAQVAALFLSAVFMLAVYVFVFISRLDVHVSPEGLSARFFPLEYHYRETRAEDMDSLRIIAVKPMKFGGWGLRLGSYGKAYIVSGKDAVEIKLKNGKSLIVGTREPKKLFAALEDAISAPAGAK
jgi:hypothetical protein